MRYLFSLIIIFLFTGFIQAQEISDKNDLSESLYLKLTNFNFIKNNEYFNPLTEGYSLIGYFIQPSLIYRPTDKLAIQLGTHILNYAGSDKKIKPQMVFSTTYNIARNTSLTLGTLNGSDKHRLSDPHFDKERVYKFYTENGLEFITKNNNLFNDTWISWEHFIFKGDTTREVFTAGESFNYSSPFFSETFNIEFPVQIQFKHYGGQISNYSGHVITYFNMSAGARFNIKLADGRFGMASAEYDRFIFKELTSKGDIGIRNGTGNWFKVIYKYKSLGISSAYWRSTDFFAPNGNPIYSSVSDYNPGLIISGRSIWTNSVTLMTAPYDFFNLYLGLDLYYDTDLKHLDSSLALHLNFNKLIRLINFRD